MISFTSRAVYGGPAPALPPGLRLVSGTRDIGSPRGACPRGPGPVSSSLAPALPLGLHPWSRGRGSPRPEPPGGASSLLSADAERAGPTSGPLPTPWSRPRLLPRGPSVPPPRRGPDLPVTLQHSFHLVLHCPCHGDFLAHSLCCAFSDFFPGPRRPRHCCVPSAPPRTVLAHNRCPIKVSRAKEP